VTNEHHLQQCAEGVRAELRAQDDLWASGWTRRRFLAGLGMAGVAVLGSQLVTTRTAYAADTGTNTLITVFLRGGSDGLRILAPNSSDLGLDYLRAVRSPLVVPSSQLIPLGGTSGWALNSAMKPLYDTLWSTGELAFVPAVSAAGVSRSHFQAQQLLDKGGSTSLTTGWLDRVLSQLGPGTTFRAVSESWSSPMSYLGPQPKLVFSDLARLDFPGWSALKAPSQQAISTLYRGMDAPLGEDVPATMSALATAASIRAGMTVHNGAAYPYGLLGNAMKDLAAIVNADVGLQVATVDVGGWDTHIQELANFDLMLTSAAQALNAFMVDLGPTRRSRVTVAVITEFGRRVAMNANGGTDHGHGGLIWLLGGGIVGGQVHGKWAPLSATTLVDGDVPGLNGAFDVLGELVQKRLGVGTLSTVFPGQTLTSLGVARTT
jgi:uncharacterized protein (DUF1501 family)